MATSTRKKLSHPHAKLAQLEDREEVNEINDRAQWKRRVIIILKLP
jgi:BMFP domain-containing protein YqiC